MVEFLFTKEVLAILAALLVFIIGRKGMKLLNIFRVAFQAYHLLEKWGVLAKLKGYEKLALAMGEFQDKFFKKFGKNPAPGDEGWAVRFFNLLSKMESKDEIEVEDFSEPSTEHSPLESL